MAKAFDFRLIGDTTARARVEGFPDRLVPLLVRNLNTVHTQLQRYIVSDKLSGQVLKSHTGNLKRNILQLAATVDGYTVTAGVGLGKNAAYGLAHEFGAHVPERVPVNAKALSWIGADGVRVFFARAKAFDIPERSFLRTSRTEFQPKIEASVESALKEAL